MASTNKSNPTRIVIADDHAMVREGLRLILSSDPELKVVALVEDGRAALQSAAEHRADLLLLDLDMPRMNGLETLRQLASAPKPVKAIVLTASIENQQIVEALHLGARGVILKEEPPHTLLKCVHAVAAGEYWVGRAAIKDLVAGIQHLTQAGTAPRYSLTAREFDIIRAVLQGDTNRAIADRLGITEQTVKNHLTNVFNKLGVSNRLELALFAARNRLVPDE